MGFRCCEFVTIHVNWIELAAKGFEAPTFLVKGCCGQSSSLQITKFVEVLDRDARKLGEARGPPNLVENLESHWSAMLSLDETGDEFSRSWWGWGIRRGFVSTDWGIVGFRVFGHVKVACFESFG